MAIGIENYPNIDTSDPTNYPHGSIKDDPAGFLGTPVDRQTYDDVHQTFRRALTNTAIAPSNTPDNVGNGYQYAKAFGLEQWQAGGTLVFTVTSALGTAVLTPVTIDYNRYRRVGKTIYYQIAISSMGITGTGSSFGVELTGIPATAPFALVNHTGVQLGLYNGTLARILGIRLNTPVFSPFFGGIEIFPIDGANFDTGSSQSLFINIVAELR